MYRGIVPATLTFGTPGNQVVASATGNTLTIFTSVQKTPMADKSESRDNDNEVLGKHRSNKRMQLQFSAKPIGAARADALAIAAACPLQDDAIVITCAGDAQIAGTAYVESAEVSWSPDGDLVITFTLIKYAATFAVAS